MYFFRVPFLLAESLLPWQEGNGTPAIGTDETKGDPITLSLCSLPPKAVHSELELHQRT